MADCCNIPLTVTEGNSVSLTVTDENTVSLDIGAAFPVYPESYKGSYNIVPSLHQQIVKVKGLYATEDIIVEKIPDNYGLITWNGSFLRIS